MPELFNTILNLLIESPANIIYHLVLAFSILSSLQAAIISRRSRKDLISNRLVLGLSMLMIGQVVLYISSGLAWQNILEDRVIMPPLDRAIMMFSLIWIIWLWAFPKPARLGDLVTGFLNLGVVILFLLSYSAWSRESATQHFNNSWIDQIWELSALFLVLVGMGILVFSRPSGWGFGMGMLSAILAGVLSHLLLPTPDKDFSSYIRLGQLAAFPLLPALLNRMAAGAAIPAAEAPAGAAAAAAPATQANFARAHERRRYSADPRTVYSWLALANANEPEQILVSITRALSHTLLSDICFIVSNSNYGQILLQTGYDLIREEVIPGTAVNQNQLPALASALQRGKALILNPADSQSSDLKAIISALGLQESGSLLFIPLILGGKSLGGILFLSPYSNRQWNNDDQGYLASHVDLIAQILQRIQQPSPALQEKVENDSQKLRTELESLRRDNKLLLIELSDYRQKDVKQAPLIPDKDLNALVALQQEAQEQIASLQAENDRLQAVLKSDNRGSLPTEELKRLEIELRKSLQDIAILQNELAEANARNLILERDVRKSGTNPSENLDIITSVVQELRQPIASISGYTDLLLAESVGILGALQRKFMERIQASTERLRSSLDDLIRVTLMSENPIELLPQPIDLSDVVDGAVTDTSAQMREKNIGLHVDLPEEMPKIFADRDAIQQIILHLLQNASAATPQEGATTLRARVQKEHGDEYLLIQVTDNGGGIRPEDLPRVFARNFRSDKGLIQGLGDTGVGLPIAKTLVEVHGGRIWVDSILGQSTTFSVLLPLHPNLANSNPMK